MKITNARAQQLFAEHQTAVYTRTDRLFAFLLIIQWLAAVITASVLSPYSWEGTLRSVHLHVKTALLLATLISSLPVYLALNHPGKVMTRHCIAIAQALYSALFIHLSGGRIETHFHVFGSLALLAMYRDWRVLITATAVVGADHYLRGLFWPQSVYGIATVDPWRWLEHATWVAFEDAFLIKSCADNTTEMKVIAVRQAELEKMDEVKELQRKAAALARIVELTNDAICSFDLSGTVLSWNAAATRIFGFEVSEVVGNKHTVLPADFDFPRLLEKIGKGELVVNHESALTRKDGSTADVALTASALRDVTGELCGISVVARDISNKKAAEKRIGEFYSTISHELRTPLTSIRGALTLMDEGVVDAAAPEGKELIKIAKTSSVRLIRLINEILDLRKIESGKLTLQLAPTKATALIDGAVASMLGMSQENQVHIIQEATCSDDVMADQDRVIQVLTNLLSNAIKFSTAGSNVVVSAERIAQSVRFSIKDSGIGIAKEEQHKLFGRFQQLDSSDSRPKEGTGLGLAICKALIEEHGGRIGVTSEAGRGSTFFFDLPAVASTNQVEQIESAKNCDILIVEDDIQLAHVIAAQLKAEGVSSYCVHSRIQCMEFLQQHRPRTILLDIRLPDGNGLEIVESLRADDTLQHIPVVLMSGDTEQMEFGLPQVFDFVAKPFDQTCLISTLKRALGKKRPRTVLIVDDDADCRAVVAAQLKSMQIQTMQAATGLEAINHLRGGNPPDLLILDVAMPSIDGFGVVQWMREHKFHDIPLLVFSGRDLEADERNSLTLALTKQLVKGTVSESDFLQAVTDLLDEFVDLPGGIKLAVA